MGYAVRSRPQVFADPATGDFVLDRMTHVAFAGATTFDRAGSVTVNEKLLATPRAATHARK